MKRFLLNLFFIASFSTAFSQAGFISFGQQDPQFTQYMFNPMMFNPAAAGTESNWVSTLAIRNQWVNMPGAPVTQSLTSHLPIYKISSGAGISIINDIAGQQRSTGVTLAYAWQKSMRKGLFSIGVNGGIVQQRLDGSKLVTPTGNYEGIIDHNDPNLPVTLQTNLIPDAGLGLYYLSDRFTVGLSAAHLLYPLTAGGEAGNATIQYNPNAYVYLAYRKPVGNLFELMPNVLYKTDLSESMIDVNLLATYKSNFLLGASYRMNTAFNSDAIALTGGLKISEKWNISYSYDITTSALNAVGAGSHEVVLSYRVPMDRPRAGKMINNPRFIYH